MFLGGICGVETRADGPNWCRLAEVLGTEGVRGRVHLLLYGRVCDVVMWESIRSLFMLARSCVFINLSICTDSDLTRGLAAMTTNGLVVWSTVPLVNCSGTMSWLSVPIGQFYWLNGLVVWSHWSKLVRVHALSCYPRTFTPGSPRFLALSE